MNRFVAPGAIHNRAIHNRAIHESPLRERMRWVLMGAAVLLGVMLLACAPTEQGQRLRIVNAGAVPITNLRVLFPDQEIVYGNVGANATTEYKVAPKGVYGYAAYRFDVNGETITQPVIDWVGESPIEGNTFTYTVKYDPNAETFIRIELVNVHRDS